MEEEEELDTSAAKLLVLTLGSKAEVCSLDLGPLLLGMWGMVCSGYRMLVEMSWKLPSLLMGQHSPQPVGMTRSSFSKYISMRWVLPRCLHQWSPNGGKPLSCLFFLDDHSSHQPDVQYWKYLVTGCSLNTELKVWSCESWTCLQAISFNMVGEDVGVRLKTDLKPTARYLVLTDIDKCLVFVLSVEKGWRGSHGGQCGRVCHPFTHLVLWLC